ncbi:MAG TPA: peptidase S7 [Clostridia bacterium]|nr:peptidase S7 [Clostridia bacterium]
MKRIKGIARYLVDRLVERTLGLSQGRNVGCFAFVDEDGYIAAHGELVDGGLNGIPLRIMLGKVTSIEGKSLIEGLKQLPDHTVFISSRPGKTGLITDVSGVDFFNLPLVNIGVKNRGLAGVGIIYPKPEYYDLSTKSEELSLQTLTTGTMEEEKEVLRQTNELGFRYLDVGEELEIVDLPEMPAVKTGFNGKDWSLPRRQVTSLDGGFAQQLVKKSMEIGQGREVAGIGVLDDEGIVRPKGRIVAGGIGFVPARLMASSAVDITGKSLREIYGELVDPQAIIVHTHPGGTGVMHVGDAQAGPGTWGRPIIAVGHSKDGRITGATVIETTHQLFDLADEDERLNLEFFEAETPDTEAEIRNRKFAIAQEYTGLCKTIEIN